MTPAAKLLISSALRPAFGPLVNWIVPAPKVSDASLRALSVKTDALLTLDDLQGAAQ